LIRFGKKPSGIRTSSRPRWSTHWRIFKYVFDKALEGKFIDRMDQNQDMFARYMNDRDFARVVADYQRKQLYEQIRAEVKQEPV
jgi:hypothetical protein